MVQRSDNSVITPLPLPTFLLTYFLHSLIVWSLVMATETPTFKLVLGKYILLEMARFLLFFIIFYTY